MPPTTPIMPSSATTSSVSLAYVRFVPGQPTGVTVLREFADPAPHQAVVSWLSTDTLPDVAPATVAQDAFHLLFIPRAAANLPDWQKRAQQWLSPSATPDNPAEASVRIRLENHEIYWRPGRAVAIAPQEQAGALLAALTEFSFYERELRRIEAELAGDWNVVASDIRLVGDVGKSDLARGAEINQITRRVLQRRMRYARLEPHLARPSRALPPLARQVVGKLRARAAIDLRLAAASDQIEVCEYVYEMANQRLGEYANFRKEYLVEWLIVALLVIEIVVMLLGLGVGWWLTP